MPIVLLVRHGRTAANATGTLAGWSPGIGLDDHGRGQAERVGERMLAGQVPVVRVVSSPLQRCQETAATIVAAAVPGLAIATDERLGECRYGAWTGRKLSELLKEPLWRTVQDQPSAVRFPDGDDFPGETMAGMQARALAAIRDVDAQVLQEHGKDAIWMAVSHGDVIKAILADAAGSHLDQFQRIQVDPASVSVVRYTSKRPFLLRSNDTGGDLASVVPPPPQPGEPGETHDGSSQGDQRSQGDEGDEGDAAVGGGAGATIDPVR
ncbi:MAG: MSMEG_4193 family putative phosphomutase [Actinomycetota bacterium]|nr:MSMEG_4193 family putative phosphomutase [Actinomycetota bacterium]